MAIEQDGKGRSDGKAIRFEAAAAASPSPTYENLFLLPSPEAEEGTAATAAAAARVSKDATMAKLGGSLGIENSEEFLLDIMRSAVFFQKYLSTCGKFEHYSITSKKFYTMK